MNGWTDDPELVAIFRAEVDEKLESLRDGLMSLEGHPSPRQVVGSLFRDAHTVKGSARALALDGVVGLAHRAEDLLGALRDGRFAVRRDLVDLLLVTAEGISRSMPGAEKPIGPEDIDLIVSALDRALAGDDPVNVPKLGRTGGNEDAASDPDAGRPRLGDSVRVPTRRVHDLLDLVGETDLSTRALDVHLATWTSLSAEFARAMTSVRRQVDILQVPASVSDGLAALGAISDQMSAASREARSDIDETHARLTRVRQGALGLAMVPLRRVVAAFPQLVREVAAATGKDVELVLEGEDVELDARVLDGVAEALGHLVTNAVDHGCGSPEERRLAGKSSRATVRVSAAAAGSSVIIEVADDGPGIDENTLRTVAIRRGLLAEDTVLTGQPLLALLFEPGFSTREVVTETSGRGVGLDVVRRAAEDLGGTTEVFSEPEVGTRFVLTLPVTLGVLRCLVARLGSERYAIPVTNVVETIALKDSNINTVAGVPTVNRGGVPVPLADLGAVLEVPGERRPAAAVVVRHGGAGGEQMAWTVDRLVGEQEIVVKDLGGFLDRPPGLAGAAIDSDGTLMLLVDVRELAERRLTGRRIPTAMSFAPTAAPLKDAATGDQSPEPAPVLARKRARVLVVEDSAGVRELQRVILEAAGYDVVTAVDGQDGAGRLGGDPVDLVLSDVEMPGMDGFTLTRTIRRTRGWEAVPVVIMTSRGDEADRRAGLDAGASAYLLKSEFDQAELVDTVRRLVGR
jgi:chemotaxis protein histidine kinase CheA